MSNITMDQETPALVPPAEPLPLAPASVVTGRRIVAGLFVGALPAIDATAEAA